MNKFYIFSFLLHLGVLFFGYRYSELKEEKLKLVPKVTMTVSLHNQRGVSSVAPVNLSKPTTEEKPQEEIKEVEKDEGIEEVKEIEKKEEVKEEIQKEAKEVVKEKKVEIKKPVKSVEKKVEKKESKKEKREKKSEKKKVTDKKLDKNLEKSKNPNPQPYNEFQDTNRFSLGADGVFTAVKSDGIEFEILREIDPKYPALAKKSNYRGKGEVTVTFVVNLEGKVEDIKFVSGENRFGFKEEVFKALKKWQFKPIIYKGKKIKVTFEKTFKFVS